LAEIVALSLYTSNAFYQQLNGMWRQDPMLKFNVDELMKFTYIVALFIKGFRNLSAYQGEVYRGTVLDLSQYKVGEVILWKAFTSTSLDKKMAIEFLQGRTVKEGDPSKKVLFTIQSKSGRRIEEISFFRNEREIVFRGYTSFKIMSISAPKENDSEIYHVELEEVCEDIRGKKVVLWVDDLRLNNQKIQEAYEKERVTFIHMETTAKAIEFLKQQSHLLKRDLSGFRIVTDMARKENGELVIKAGLIFIQELRKLFPDYKEKIMVFTGSEHIEANRLKFVVAGMNENDVEITCESQKASDFVSFQRN